MNDPKIQSLFHIYNSEQNTISRLDQKAYTLISFSGVLMAFFVVHYKSIPDNPLLQFLTLSYFLSAILSLSTLLLVIVPRILSREVKHHGKLNQNPLYFAGIVNHQSAYAYHEHIESLIDDPREFRRVVSDSIFSMATINQHKIRYFQIGAIFFTVTLYLEIFIILVKFLSE